MGKPEAYVEDYLVKQCKKRDILCWKLTCPGISGVPDRLLIGHGKILFVETKSKVGKLRKLQEKIINAMINHGAIVYTANTREVVDEILCQEFDTSK